jgi:hypothetical protein
LRNARLPGTVASDSQRRPVGMIPAVRRALALARDPIDHAGDGHELGSIELGKPPDLGVEIGEFPASQLPV